MAVSGILKHRPFYRLLMSMTLVLLIPLLLILSCFSYGLNDIVTEDYISMNNQIIDNITSTIDAAITSQTNFSYSLSSMTTLKRMSANIIENPLDQQESCQELRDVLSSILFNNIASSVAIYMPDANIVVSTSTSAANRDDFYNRYISYNGISSDDFYSMVGLTKTQRYFKSAPASPSMCNRRNILLYIQSISQGYLSPRAYFFAIIDESALTELVTNSFDSDVQFQLLNADGEELLRSSGVLDEWNDVASGASDASSVAGNYQVFYPYTLSCGLRFIFYLPESIVMRQIDRFMLICGFATLVCLIVGLAIAINLSRRLYKPYRTLLATAFPEGVSDDASNVYEGFRRITDKVLETQLMNNRFQDELQVYFSTMRDTALLNLLTRSAYLSESDLCEAAEICKLPINFYSYQVAMFKTLDGQCDFPAVTLEDDAKAAICTARLSALQYVAVVALSGDDTGNPLEALIDKCGENFHYGLSNIHGNIRDLNRCIGEADAACQAKFESAPAAGKLDIDSSATYYTIKHELQLIAATRNGIYDEVCRILNDIRDSMQANGKSATDIKVLYELMTSTAIKMYDQLSEDAKHVLEGEARRIGDMHARDLNDEQAFSDILSFYRQMCNAASSDIHIKNQQIIENVRSYLNDNYADPSLCLDVVADHMNVSYYFLSRIFKSETNQSFSDILNDTRIYRAMELLRTTQLPVQAISAQVGYTNWSTFLRAFHKRAGTTPLQYRNAGE